MSGSGMKQGRRSRRGKNPQGSEKGRRGMTPGWNRATRSIRRFSNAEGEETSGEEPETTGGSPHVSKAAPVEVSGQGPKPERGTTTLSLGCGMPELGKPRGRPDAVGESGNRIADTGSR